ncbi:MULTISPECIES: hypothetical protein [Rodentibacter]|uniref:hypothetical protein n=1 Tax=Rodentibacter TaxID=1960084 RepID=UPI001CFC7C19|nr:hypothetical protein [Rodentibacter sp. JRC1]GJI56760.1 hypothetical protein HEMROJRC1_18720 [Rodentibacter sp. JRC1]
MLYITNYNYRNLIKTLDINIPSYFKKEYYRGYQLKDIPLDLAYFSENEAKLLVISDLLYRDLSNLNRRMYFIQNKQEQNKWVFKLGMPAYHAHSECEALNSDFENILRPASLKDEDVKAYGEMILANKERYQAGTEISVIIAFCQELKDTFKLEESIQEIARLPKRYENTGIYEAFFNLASEEQLAEIKRVSRLFRLYVQDSSKERVRCFSALLHSDDLCEEDQLKMEKIQALKYQLQMWILHFHFQYAFSQGIDITEKILHLSGFRRCRCFNN